MARANPFEAIEQRNRDRREQQEAFWRGLDHEPVAAPPVREEPVWNIPNIEEHWWDMQRAMMDIPPPAPQPDPINRGRRIEIDWGIARPWGNGRPIHIEREEDMQGKVYGEDYS